MTIEFRGASRISGPEACASILLVGEMNPYGADPGYALYHEPERAAGRQLQHKILGIDARHWYLPMWRTNLCVGDWDGRDARRRAADLIEPQAPWSIVVMLGKKVGEAFKHAADLGDMAPAPFAIAYYGRLQLHPTASSTTLVSLPHPSLRNAAVWARPDAIDRARAVMREVSPAIPWGELG